MPCTSDAANLRFSSSGMRGAWSRTISVVIARGRHLFPFRTEQLSPSAPMVLGLRGPGRVGRRRINLTGRPTGAARLRLARPYEKPLRIRARMSVLAIILIVLAVLVLVF